MAKQNKPVSLSVMYLMLHRDELLKCRLAASMLTRNIPSKTVDQILAEAFKKVQREYINDSRKAKNNWAEMLRHRFTLIPKS